MKRAILTAATVVLVAMAAAGAPAATAAGPQVTVLLAGGAEESEIHIALSIDGRTYVIDSLAQLEVGGNVCWHPEGLPNELICDAPAIAGFEVNAGSGDDTVVVSSGVPVPVTLRGGPGNDHLLGGLATDKIVGGPGDDVLNGRLGNDSLFGGPGDDRLIGGPGNDVLRGGAGADDLLGGPGRNDVSQ